MIPTRLSTLFESRYDISQRGRLLRYMLEDTRDIKRFQQV